MAVLESRKLSKTRYDGKNYYLIDYFEFKGRKYYYIVDENCLDENGDIMYNQKVDKNSKFIYKIYDRYFNCVDDDKLNEQLLGVVNKRIDTKENKYFVRYLESKREA